MTRSLFSQRFLVLALVLLGASGCKYYNGNCRGGHCFGDDESPWDSTWCRPSSSADGGPSQQQDGAVASPPDASPTTVPDAGSSAADAGLADAGPPPFCASDGECARGSVCRSGVCRTPCPGGTAAECRRADAQLTICRAIGSGELLCFAGTE